jgi:lipoprotein-anchoring transpeptidase ErfK/SrfK
MQRPSFDLDRSRPGAGPSSPFFKVAAAAAAACMFVVGVWYAAQVVVLNYMAAAAVNSSVARVSAPVRLEQTLQLNVHGAGVALQSAELSRTDTSTQSAEQSVPIRLQPMADEGTWQVLPADDTQSLLHTDGAYRLVVSVEALRPGLPLPYTDSVQRQYRFTTVASPHADVPTEVLQPRWSEPVSFTWSAPMQAVGATVEPDALITTWIDAQDPRKAVVQLGDAHGGGVVGGQTYEVRVDEARSTDGLSLQRPISFKVATPERPRFVEPPTEPVMLRLGDALTLRTSADVTNVQAATTTDTPAKLAIGPSDITLTLPDFRQGASFDLNVHGATSLQGAPLEQPLTIHVTTPPALGEPTLEPEDEAVDIPPVIHPSILFPEAVVNLDVATRALKIDPPVPGHWEWGPASRRAEFIPDERLPILTTLTLSVRGGPDGPRTAAGGYLANDLSASFTTTDYKRLDVSLSRQTMTLFENDVPIRTIYVATGVAGAPTPTGNFSVLFKSPQMRFRGMNPDGSHYDIPDVHWVMPFWGDYTIHGAYWRGRFGAPGSAGCVSMTDSDAKVVYDWADIGTPISIHS